MIRKNMYNVSHAKAGIILNMPQFQHGQSTQKYHGNAQNANHKNGKKGTEEHLGAEDQPKKNGIALKGGNMILKKLTFI